MTLEIVQVLDHGPWPRFAKLVTFMCALAIIFDGFDISVVGFAIPSILKDWHLARASFAPLLVIGLFGMTVGSTSAGYMGDRLGRRVALSLSVLIFGVAIVASAFAPDLLTIEILRFIAAAGIGGALPTAATLSAEFTPLTMRTVAVMVTIVCIPLGGALAGSAAAAILPVAGWRALFLVGGIAPIILSLAMFLVVPESPRFLARHPERAPELHRLLARLGRTVPPNTTIVESIADQPDQSISLKDFFGGEHTRNTLALWLTFFSSTSCVYMSLSWLPAMLSANGLGLAGASQGLAAYNYGGVAGVLCFVSLINRFGSRLLTLVTSTLAVLTAVALTITEIGQGADSVLLLAALAAHGFCVNALQTSLFALGVHLYPTRVRASGVAAGSAVGRVGGMVSASLGPLVIQAGRAAFFEYLAFGMLIALIGLSVLRNHIPSVGARKIAAVL